MAEVGTGNPGLERIAKTCIGAAFEVSNLLGAGFLERVYENALGRRGLHVAQQKPLPVRCKGTVVGDYYADMLIEQALLVELKCVEALRDEHLAQCLNYLAAANLPLGLVFNFQNSRVEFRRVIRT